VSPRHFRTRHGPALRFNKLLHSTKLPEQAPGLNISTLHSLRIIYFDVLQYKIAPAFDDDVIAGAFWTVEDQIVDFHPGVTGLAAAGGFDLVNYDFRSFDQRAGRKQLESEADRIAVDSREPSDVHFNTAYFPAMARSMDLAPDLLDQCVNDG
jgi:hypothetical protein